MPIEDEVFFTGCAHAFSKYTFSYAQQEKGAWTSVSQFPFRPTHTLCAVEA